MAFIPRHAYIPPESIPRSYFLGHHRSGLSKMTSMLAQIDLIIECRDYRVPLSSTNPMFERLLQGRKRLIVFTKRDVGSPFPPTLADKKREALLSSHFHPSTSLFTASTPKDTNRVLTLIRQHARDRQSLTGSRLLVVGMPNVGKSTLLNALRAAGVHKGKAARTGAQPGITRSIASSVKIVEPDERSGAGAVYLIDTPGVFVPFVPDPETMLKLSLVGCVKDGIVPLETCVDYLLYRMNLVDPEAYGAWCPPTNEIGVLLENVAKRTGRLGKGATLDLEAAALWVLQKWRTGHMGKFVLDEVSEETLEERRKMDGAVSMNQAKKRGKEALRQKSKSQNMEE
ncbi:mitochondrial GTPase-like protein 1 [Myriangium duriaei CBS 260.36]|uniref:Mitochondrial GTPase 1 n=1 Tax=Myriangium duriaei CBS 260.36 TaxID=1168546 RepID=A0A9P4MED7_9PEZI|nr:mitochondrial GTPase-like protein 1 [Myriangium duriaei CBS 260.36]